MDGWTPWSENWLLSAHIGYTNSSFTVFLDTQTFFINTTLTLCLASTVIHILKFH